LRLDLGARARPFSSSWVNGPPVIDDSFFRPSHHSAPPVRAGLHSGRYYRTRALASFFQIHHPRARGCGTALRSRKSAQPARGVVRGQGKAHSPLVALCAVKEKRTARSWRCARSRKVRLCFFKSGRPQAGSRAPQPVRFVFSGATNPGRQHCTKVRRCFFQVRHPQAGRCARTGRQIHFHGRTAWDERHRPCFCFHPPSSALTLPNRT
jgi:hypothetical protein